MRERTRETVGSEEERKLVFLLRTDHDRQVSQLANESLFRVSENLL